MYKLNETIKEAIHKQVLKEISRHNIKKASEISDRYIFSIFESLDEAFEIELEYIISEVNSEKG